MQTDGALDRRKDKRSDGGNEPSVAAAELSGG